MTQIPSSRRTTQRRIFEISTDVAVTMRSDLKSCLAFSLALDESTNTQGNPQLAIFVRFVLSDLTIKKELLNLVTLRKITCGIDIKNGFDEALTRANVPLNKLVRVATNGAPVIVCKRVGLIGVF